LTFFNYWAKLLTNVRSPLKVEGETGPFEYESVTGPLRVEGETGPFEYESVTDSLSVEGETDPFDYESVTGPLNGWRGKLVLLSMKV
jgi:hypothetical protein